MTAAPGRTLPGPKLSFDDRAYQRAHGRAPHLHTYGHWCFAINGRTVTKVGKLLDCKRALRAERTTYGEPGDEIVAELLP